MKPLLPRFAFMVALGLATTAHAADVGRVLLAAGNAVAVRGNQTVSLTYGAMIQDKDLLRTGAASNLQVRFSDESIVSLKENSELRIDDFRFSGKEDGNERGFLSLLKGGLRTVTGLVGRANHANYRLSTVTATIGIRGTDYAATLCQGDCRNSDGSLAKDGLYGRTHGISHGTNHIDVSNERDQKSFGINENFYVADAKSIVEPLLVAPDFVSNKLESRKQGGTKSASGGSGTEQATTGGAASESRPSTTPEALPQLQFVATQSLGPQGTPAVLPPANGWVVIYPFFSTAEAVFDGNKDVGVYNSLNQLLSYGTAGIAPYGTSGGAIVDTGSYIYPNGQVLTWGRWTGNTQILTLGGTPLSNVPVLFGTATGLTQGNSSLQPSSGTATYTYVGGPSPVDAGGNTGTLTSSSLTLNFTAQSATYSMSANFSGAAFTVSGIGSRTYGIRTGDFGGSLSGTCTGIYCANPSVSGGFDIGTGGPNGYELAVVGGGFNGTLAGPVVFLNSYQSNSFTPGPSGQTGELAFASATPSFANNTGTGSLSQFSGTNLIAFGNGSPGSALSGSLGAGTVIETGSTLLVDGSTMNWGRWSGSTTVFPSPNTGVTSPPTGVPYVVGNGNTVLPISGSFTYTFAGGPNPVNTSGAIGLFSGGALNISFGATSGTIAVATPLTLAVGGVNYSLTTCTACTFTNSPAITNTMSLSGTCVGGVCSASAPASSNATGVFVGPQGAGLALAGNIFSPAPTVAFAAGFKR
ncbi:MAG: FecR family protein [Burkholderiales bacterium]|jgi:hypothetical protein|nr:FecR family protein [Burkholderiales bacterium]